MIDLEQVHLWWRLFHRDNTSVEVRMIKSDKLNASGYYKNLNNIIRDIDFYDKKDGWQIYFVLNEIDDACYTRQQCEHSIERPTATTTDDNITARRWVFIDLDPKRPKETSSSNAQLEQARIKANQIFKFLKQQGFENMVVAMSGNGYHIQIPCSLSNTAENKSLVERFLEALQMLFEDDAIEVDQKPKNAARLCKLYGTTAKKGTNTEDRPHRLSKILKFPDEIIPNKREYFENVANLYHKETPLPSKENNWGREKFNVEDFLNKHGLSYRKKEIGEGTRYLLEECPFNSDHKHGDAMVFQHRGGALEFYCFHNSCSQYHWRDFRLHFEPDAYDKKDYREFRSKQQYYEKYEPIQIKEETSENGKKWLDWNDIQDINDADLVAIKSGYFLLDKLIKGWVLGELTILCGLNSSGKSTILNSFALNAIQRNYPTAYFSGELRPQRLKQWIAQVAAGKANVTKNPDTDFSYDVNPDVLPKISEWLNGKLKIYSHEKYGNLSKQLINDITDCIVKFGVKLILIDNLMSVSLDGESGDKNEKQKNFVIEISNLAKMYGVHVILVVHPRKENGLQFLRKESVKGAGDITDAADNVLLIHRVGDDFEKRATEFLGKERVANLILYDNVIEIAKNRDYGNNDKYVGLYFEPESRRYKNSKAEQIHYDWEEHYEEYTVPEEPHPLPTTIHPNQSFDTPVEPLYPQKEDDAYWGQFRNDTDNCPF